MTTKYKLTKIYNYSIVKKEHFFNQTDNKSQGATWIPSSTLTPMGIV